MLPIIMKTFPGFFLIFAYLMIEGQPQRDELRCEHCNRDGLSCTGRREICEKHFNTCAVVLVEYTHWGRPRLRTVKTCEQPNVCKKPLNYLNMGGGRYERTSIACCKGVACRTATPPRFPPGFIKPNGKSCPACFATNKFQCGSARVDCSGDERHCVNTYQQIKRGSSTVTYYKKGCASNLLCYRRSGSYIKYGNYSNPLPSCTNAMRFG